MSGPWDDYKAQAAEKTASTVNAPWEDYAAKNIKDKGLWAASQPNLTVQEMHPDISLADRWISKAVTDDPKAQAAYIQKKYPKLDVGVSKSGQVTARSKDNPNGPYNVVDPNTGAFSSDIIGDTGDIMYDAISGAATTGASVGGATLAAPGGPAAMMPAAMGAGAVTAGGLESARQAIARKLGAVNPDAQNELANPQVSDVAIATMAGGLQPLISGAGPELKGAGNIAWDAAKKPIGNTAAKMGSLISGAPTEDIATFAGRNKEYLAIEKNPEGLLKYVENTGDRLNGLFQNEKQKTYGQYQALLGAGADAKTVSLESTKNVLKSAIADAEAEAARKNHTPETAKLVNELKDVYNEYFVGSVTQKVPELTQVPTGLMDASGKPAMKTVEKIVEKKVPQENTAYSPFDATELTKKLQNIEANYSNKLTGGSFKPSDDYVAKKLGVIGTKANQALREDISKVVPPEAAPLLARYGEVSDVEDDVTRLLQNKRQAFTNLKNSGFSNNPVNAQVFKRVDRVLPGADLEKTAKLASAFETFSPGRRSFFSDLKSEARNRVPAATLGGLAGYSLGRSDGEGSGYVPAVVGAGLGAFAGGPAMMRRYIQAGIGAGKMGANVAENARWYDPRQAAALKLLVQPEVKSAWLQMNKEKK